MQSEAAWDWGKEIGASAEKGQFGLGDGHKIQARNPMGHFIMTKQIAYNRPLEILASLQLVWYL